MADQPGPMVHRHPPTPTRTIPDIPVQELLDLSPPRSNSLSVNGTRGHSLDTSETERPPPGPDPGLSAQTTPSSTTNEGQDVTPREQNSPSRHHSLPDDTELTALRAHYLKKSLIELEFEQELAALMRSVPNHVSPLSYLGPPFSRPPKDAPGLSLPFLRYIFRQFVLTFPFLASAPKDFFPEKLQPFVASVLARNLSPTSIMDGADPVAGDAATRMKLQHKIQRNLALFVGAATKLTEREEVVRLTQADLDRLEAIARKRKERENRKGGIFEINIVCVRATVEKHRIRSRVHDEFIIRTRRSGFNDVFVARRHGDFKTLADELKKAYPDAIVPQPPSKDKSGVDAPNNPTSPISPGLSRVPTSASVSSVLSDDSQPGSPGGSRRFGGQRLAREKNRLTLRAYLHSLMGSSTFASSPQLRSFLTSGPTQLSPEEEEDARRREEADLLRDEGRKRFAREIAQRVEGLRGALRTVKGDLMGKDGLTHIFAVIKTTENVRQLPKEYEAVLEWARISLASTVFQNFVAADTASEMLASLKRIHGMMPYFMLKTALKISNPIGMMRSVIDLFMAQPFGTQSLLQRMFTSSLQEEVRDIEAQIAAVEDAVDDPVMCEKVKIFINAPKEFQAIYKADAAAENINILAAVLRSPEAPALSRAQMHRVIKSHRAHVEYLRQRAKLKDSDDDEGPEQEEAWLFEDLTVLGKLYAKLRDRQQIIELVFEGTTAELLRDIITIFYAPLAQVYKAASISDSIGDLQNFINDLIRTVEQVDESTQSDPQRTVKVFADLIQRHEQAFYHFVHKVHSKGENLFDGLMHWIELFLTVVREGISPDPLSLEFLLPHAGQERTQILKEVDEVALYHYKLKVAYEEKLRRRFGRTQDSHNGADAEDEAAQALVNGVVDELSFDELMQGTAMDDAAAAATDESSSEEEETDSDSGSDYTSSIESADHTPTTTLGRSQTVADRSSRRPHLHSRRSSSQGRRDALPTGKNGLRPSRSMTFDSARPHKNVDRDLPPVPPLPPSLKSQTVSRNKPLPPNPGTNGRTSHEGRARPVVNTSVGNPRSPLSRNSQDSKHEPPPRSSVQSDRRRPQSLAAKRTPRPEQAKPPTLQHIPNLLPIFVEMMRPSLEPRQVV